MRRQRSVSFYADTQEEYMEELNKKNQYPREGDADQIVINIIAQQIMIFQKIQNIFKKKKFFQSYDDLEIEQLGVNSTYQLTKLENQDIEDNEGGLIKKINNINLSFKEINNNSFFSNLTPFTKNIIGKFGIKKNKKRKVYLNGIKPIPLI